MDELYLVQPSIEHRSQYEAMMDEWELFGGRLNPGALSRYSHRWKRNVDYDEWLKWIEDDIDKSLYDNYNIIMNSLNFEWDENKNKIDKQKHRISFEEAETVFDDVSAIVIEDPDHSQEED